MKINARNDPNINPKDSKALFSLKAFPRSVDKHEQKSSQE